MPCIRCCHSTVTSIHVSRQAHVYNSKYNSEHRIGIININSNCLHFVVSHVLWIGLHSAQLWVLWCVRIIIMNARSWNEMDATPSPVCYWLMVWCVFVLLATKISCFVFSIRLYVVHLLDACKHLSIALIKSCITAKMLERKKKMSGPIPLLSPQRLTHIVSISFSRPCISIGL